MDERRAELWKKIRNHPLDDPGDPFRFSDKLAKENGWTGGKARRVVEEYRRFVFLAVAADHPVSPSDPVDQAWHLHMTYTRPYWDDFCGRVLGTPLHHGPSRGGTAERAKFDGWYKDTLESYRRLFGEEPPADLWPSPAEHALEAGRYERVGLGGAWVIRKAVVRSAALVGALLVLLCGAVAGLGWETLASAENPLKLRGPAFLETYLGALAAAALGGFLLRRVLRHSRGDGTDLDAYQIACLQGGEEHVLRTAVVRLAAQGNLAIDADSVRRGKTPLPPRHPVEKAVDSFYNPLWKKEDWLGWAGQRLARLLPEISEDLRARGLIVSPTAEFVARWAPLVAIALVGLLGVAKLAMGLNHDRPVGFLALALIATVVLIVAFVRGEKGLRRTVRGQRLVEDLKERYSLLQRTADKSPTQVALAAAIFGTAVLAGGPFASIAYAVQPPPPPPQVWDGGSSGGGGCGSGCGSGCGGGCGGCGGCG